MLEEDIAVLVGAAHGWTFGVQAVLAERIDRIHIDHVLKILVVPDGDLLDLVGGAEAVEEVDEGNAALDGSQVRNSAKVHNFLGVGLSQHGKAGLAAGVDVGVVAEDVQRVAGNGSGGNMEDTGQKLAGDLVHVGDHEQQTLGSGVGGGQGAGGQRAVHRARSTGLRLHLDNLYPIAEDVLTALSRPLVNVVGHGAGGGNGVDTSYFSKGVADMSGSGIAVHGFQLSLQWNYLLIKGNKSRFLTYLL